MVAVSSATPVTQGIRHYFLTGGEAAASGVATPHWSSPETLFTMQDQAAQQCLNTCDITGFLQEITNQQWRKVRPRLTTVAACWSWPNSNCISCFIHCSFAQKYLNSSCSLWILSTGRRSSIALYSQDGFETVTDIYTVPDQIHTHQHIPAFSSRAVFNILSHGVITPRSIILK